MGRLKAATGEATDTWLTPPDLMKALGTFDLDPCCPAKMPWRTARVMVSNETTRGARNTKLEDGLEMSWHPYGRTFCNPPYSGVLGWVQKMTAHRNGVLLVGGRGPETKWGQLVLSAADAVFYPEGRFYFHFKNGKPSDAAWQPSLLAAWGRQNVKALAALPKAGFNGVLLGRLS